MKNGILGLVAFLSINLYAQTGAASTSIAKNYPLSLVFNSEFSKGPSLANLNSWFRNNYHADAHFYFEQSDLKAGHAGLTFVKYNQLYKNIPVYNSMLNVRVKNNAVINFNGEFYPYISIDTVAVLSAHKALEELLNTYGNAQFAWQDAASEQRLKYMKSDKNATYYPSAKKVIVPLKSEDGTYQFRLAYQFDIYTVEPLARELVMLDANTGSILTREPILCNEDVQGKGKTLFSGVRTFSCDSLNKDSFILRSNKYQVQTINGRNWQQLDSNLIYTNQQSEWPKKYQTVLDIQWGLERTKDYYLSKFNLNSINDSGFKLYGVAHAGNHLANAYWDGFCAFFGDGDWVQYKNFTSLDVCGHEITHGVTQKSAHLIYSYESGALNESYSDIFGKCIEHTYLPDSFNWLVSQKIMFKGDCLRNMSNPNLKNHPKYYKGLNYWPNYDSWDNGGVHENSSIQNYWFYLMVEGGKGNREDNTATPFTVNGIGWQKAETLALFTLRHYLTPHSDYHEASRLSILAAKDLFGSFTKEAYEVQLAWWAVGLAEMPSSIQTVEKLNTRLVLQPNPSHDQIKLHVNGYDFTESTAEIIDLTGKVIENVKVFNGAQINIEAYEAGVYFLRFADGSCLKFCKL